MWETILTGVISGLIASVVFFIFLQIVKPRLKVSKQVSRSENNGRILYRIKVVNRSLSMICNLKYTLYYCSKNTERLVNIQEIEPAKSPFTTIKGRRKKDKHNEHAVRISYYFDEEQYPLKNGMYLKFVITANHSVTSTLKAVTRVYTEDDVITGSFETGDSFHIIPPNS